MIEIESERERLREAERENAKRQGCSSSYKQYHVAT